MRLDRSLGLFGFKVLNKPDAEHQIRSQIDWSVQDARPVQAHHLAVAYEIGQEREPVLVRIDNVIGAARESG